MAVAGTRRRAGRSIARTSARRTYTWRPGRMLWSRPVRAQRAIVERLTDTFAAAKISAASLRLIQSEATRGIGTVGQPFESPLPAARFLPDIDVEPPVLGAVPPPLDDPASLDPDAVPGPGVPLAAGAASVAAAAFPSPLAPSFASPVAAGAPAGADRASFFAQPLPLKWIAGAVSAFLITPPQTSHVSGPVPEIGWMTSTDRPQEVQRYS